MASKQEASSSATIDDPTKAMHVLYARLWALQQLLSSGFISYVLDMSTTNLSKFSQVEFSGQTGFLKECLLWVEYIAVFYRPDNAKILTAVHILNMIVHTMKIPFLWDYEIWDWLMELTVVTMGTEFGASLVRWQLITFYVATATFKLTRSFLSHKVSCAPIFVLALVDMMMPKSGLVVPQTMITILAWSAPAVTILIEFLIPLLLATAPRWGVLIGLLFHFLITIQPPPGNAGGFSVSLAVRYVFFCQCGSEKKSPKWYISVSLVAVAIALGRSHGDDWAVPVHVIMILALVPHALETGQNQFSRHANRSPMVIFIFALTILYAFGMPILGGDMGAATMFSNLRVYSKSNHLMLPTGVLLNTTMVRIDFTTSKHINSVHPNEATRLLSPRLRTWLQSTGHTGRQFAPYLKRSLNVTVTSNGETDFVPYIIPDLEVRRLVQEAYDSGEDAFRLEYTKLPLLEKIIFYAKDRSCISAPTNGGSFPTNCSHDEFVLNAGLPFRQSKTLLFFSFPVVSDAIEDVDFSELGCLC